MKSRFEGIDPEVTTSINPRGWLTADQTEMKLQQQAKTASKNNSAQRSAQLQEEARKLEYRNRRINDKLGGSRVHTPLRGPQHGHKSATAHGRHATGQQTWRRPPSEEEEEWMEEALEEDLELIRTASQDQPQGRARAAAFTLADFM